MTLPLLLAPNRLTSNTPEEIEPLFRGISRDWIIYDSEKDCLVRCSSVFASANLELIEKTYSAIEGHLWEEHQLTYRDLSIPVDRLFLPSVELVREIERAAIRLTTGAEFTSSDDEME